MVIVELIGSISLIFVLISAILLIIVHIKNKQNPITIIHDQQLNNNKQTDVNFEDVINVIKNDEISLSSPIKYGIQWTKSEMIDSSSKDIFERSEFEQGDSLSFTDQDTIEKSYQTIRNQLKMSKPYSISNLDITIPSNLSSSIDLEQFECTSTTSNLSEFLKD
jgi:hypothetical protein